MKQRYIFIALPLAALAMCSKGYSQDDLPLPPQIRDYAPWLAHELEELWTVAHDNPAALKENLRGVLNVGLVQAKMLAGGEDPRFIARRPDGQIEGRIVMSID